MPGLARKVVICAAVDGLVLQPLNSKKERTQPAYWIKYGDASIIPVPKDLVPAAPEPNSSFEAFGIVGLVTVFRYSYLISITRRQQVAQIRGLPIYLITEVALTPCTSQHDANEAIAKTALALNARTSPQATDDEESATEDETLESRVSVDEIDDSTDLPAETAESSARSGSPRSSIAQDVISRRGSYGRFAQSWFSRAGWTQGQKRNMGLSPEQAVLDSSDESVDKKEGAVPTKIPIPDDAAGSEAALALLPKLLRSSQILFGTSKTFYYSYDLDITRSLASNKAPATAGAPTYKDVDPNYFWNRYIMQPFIKAGVESLALPLMQGFVGQRSFVVDSHPPQVEDGAAKESVEMSDFAPGNTTGTTTGATTGSTTETASPPPNENETANIRPSEKKFDITIISRRSTKRAGLRYLRRGIDEQGNVANSVETEQILSPADAAGDSDAKVYSFVQIRGSFPVFFTQSPYSLKPTPVMMHSPDANFAALKKHFDGLQKKYGDLQVVNLVEKHGVEASIGVQYEKNVERLNEEAGSDTEKVGYEWFDFHAVCRGMKFENVSFLLEILGKKLESFGSTVAVDGKVVETQKGVLRTNCMDCLDRTNVCQSSFGKYMLDHQLKQQGFDMAVQADQENAWFNTLWADNGDAISKQYASTGAMKGDYTRTRKRNYRGALTDAGLSLTRLFNGMFNDFFLQTTIDFLLGNVTALVFEEFEANMMTKDPAVSMQNMRQQAIDMCQKRVVADDTEEFVGGWTFLTPTAPDTIRTASLEEAVLLLTDVALYLCRFDWNLDKISSFERVDLAHIKKIKFGTYITSTISSAQIDEMRNVGLVIEYKPGSTDITRVNTRSLSSMSGTPKAQEATGFASFLSRAGRAQNVTEPPPRRIALKALYGRSSVANQIADEGDDKKDEPGAIIRLSEVQEVVLAASEIDRLAIQNQPRQAGSKPGDVTLVEKGDIISLAEARKNTTLLEQLGHSIKKLVWA